MATNHQLWDALAPEYAGDLDATKDLFLELAASQMDAEAWDGLYQQGAVWLALHLRLTGPGKGEAGMAGAGPVVAEKAGDLARSYGAVVGVLSRDALLATTRFGLEYLRLRRMLVLTPMIVGDDVYTHTGSGS